ncbi:glycoside hydrolase family 3 N-terminal domain-containing protein [Pseudonocardia sp. CA-107938]|uniref:glycoside hydrolase family 3 N-terminal domain-containing protein n=1 Tax=Pseudonocardia sp. CA-107938 TaxID=3240021 RepID=UPI003D93B87D
MGSSVARRCLTALAAGAVLCGLVTLPALAATPALPPPAPPAPAPPAEPSCAAVVAGMTPQAKLAQRLVVGVDAADVAGTVATVRDTQVGGIFLGGNATALLKNQALQQVQAVSRVPIAVAVDDEGGRVQRIDDLDGQLPSARSMAKQTPEAVRALAEKRGRQLVARGVTVDYAPSVDVSNQPATAVIGDRSFSNDPAVVTTYAAAFADGLRAAGVTPVFKHFPGHGHSSGDSHKGRVSTPPLDQLRAADLRPYETLPQAKDQVMVGHLDVPGLTTDLPTSLTPAAYALLRDDYRFDGVVVTDDLGAMKAITDRFTVPQAVTKALAAGADQALWSAGGDARPVLTALEKALADGTLDAAANDTAVARVLAGKGTCAR